MKPRRAALKPSKKAPARSKRTTAISWPDDPVVAEVRRIRAAMWKEAGGDFDAYFEMVKREGAERDLVRKGKTKSVRRGRVTRTRRAATPRPRRKA
jgi:hypothetical protein